MPIVARLAVAAVIAVSLLDASISYGRHARPTVSPPARGDRARTPPARAFEETMTALAALSPAANRVARVAGLSITRDVATFTLHSGTLALLSPVGGRTVGFVFTGAGTFSYQPPTPVERRNLRRYYEADSLLQPFRSLVVLFADTTVEELEASLTFGPDAVDRDAEREIEEALKYLTMELEGHFDGGVITALANGHRNELFYAHLAQDRGKPLIFSIDPYQAEEVSLSHRPKRARRKYPEVVNQFDLKADYAAGEQEDETQRDLVRLNEYVVESTIDGGLHFSATTSVAITPLVPQLEWVRLHLYSELAIDSAQWADGTPLEYYRPKDDSDWWIRLDPEHAPGDARRLTAYYQGDLLERADVLEGMRTRGDRARIKLPRLRSSSLWYPRHGRHRASFDVTFHTPVKWAFASVGERISEERTDKVLTTRWRAPAARNVSFSLGRFDEQDLTDPRIPPVTLHYSRELHETLRAKNEAGEEVSFLLQQDIGHAVGADLANSFWFFHNFFGATPVQRFYAVEIPGFHGEAFPGLVHLSWMTFQWTRDDGTDEMFRAHEVAHQWWGIAVDFATYRDQWLSEGFSSFAALWYLLKARRNAEKYFEVLEEWGDAIRKRGRKTGAIGLGYRVADSENGGDYQLIVYRKGAWVLHMLRNLFIDLKTMEEDRFEAMLQDFYQTHRGKTATTADFQAVVEKHLGTPMGWFFDQWVYGTEIPTYRFAYRVEEGADGSIIAKVRVRQEDVPDHFLMIVPVFFDFGAQGTARTRLLVEGPLTEADLALPMKPKNIVLNDLQSVLAKVDKESY